MGAHIILISNRNACVFTLGNRGRGAIQRGAQDPYHYYQGGKGGLVKTKPLIYQS